MSEGTSEFLLCLADDEHVMGQRHTEWIGVAPFLEEDLAFASIGQDELGHAAMLYELLSGPDGDIDDLALGRTEDEYRSCWLVERECSDWADALVRHWMYDAAEPLRWQMFENSSIDELRGIAARALSEETFHIRHGDAMVDALWQSVDARSRLTSSVAKLLPSAVSMFEAPAGELDAIDEAVVSTSMVTLLPEWQQRVDARFGPQDWSSVEPVQQQARTVRSPAFGPMYDAMREVILIDPKATW